MAESGGEREKKQKLFLSKLQVLGARYAPRARNVRLTEAAGDRSNGRRIKSSAPGWRESVSIRERERDARSGLTKNTRLMAASVYLEKL